MFRIKAKPVNWNFYFDELYSNLNTLPLPSLSLSLSVNPLVIYISSFIAPRFAVLSIKTIFPGRYSIFRIRANIVFHHFTLLSSSLLIYLFPLFSFRVEIKVSNSIHLYSASVTEV